MLSVDGQSGQCVDLQDHSRPASDGGSETVQSAPVWSMAGLSNTLHTLTVSMCPNAQYVILDAITYAADRLSVLSFISLFKPLHPCSYTVDTATAVTTSAPGGNNSPINPTLPPPSGNPTLQPQTVTVTSDGSAFTYTIAVGPSSSSTPSAAGDSQNQATKSSSHTTAIAIGAGVGGFSFLSAVVLLSLFCLQRRKQPKVTLIPEDDATQYSSATPQPAPSQMSNAPLVAGNQAQPAPLQMSNAPLVAGNQVPATHGMMNHHPYASPYDNMNPQLVPGQYTSWAGSPMSHPSTLTPITEGSPYSQLATRPNLPEV
jgi:hypothetical protein